MVKSPHLYSLPGTDELAPLLRAHVLACQNAGVAHHGEFRVAVSGGSLPKTLAKALLAGGDGSPEDAVQFDRWVVFFADERAVALDHEDSNYRLLKEELLDKIPEGLGTPAVHTVQPRLLNDPQELADEYESQLVGTFAAKDSVKVPIFDLVLLGCGPDGHTCSLFPGHALLRETAGWVQPIEDSPKPPAGRITFTLPVVHAAAKVAFVATGEGKSGVLHRIFDTEEGQALPCALVNAGGEDKVSWFCDDAATAEVTSVPKRTAI